MSMCDGVHYPTVSYPYRLLVDSIVQVSLTNNIIVVSARATLLFDCSLLQGHCCLCTCLRRQAHIFLVKYFCGYLFITKQLGLGLLRSRERMSNVAGFSDLKKNNDGKEGEKEVLVVSDAASKVRIRSLICCSKDRENCTQV